MLLDHGALQWDGLPVLKSQVPTLLQPIQNPPSVVDATDLVDNAAAAAAFTILDMQMLDILVDQICGNWFPREVVGDYDQAHFDTSPLYLGHLH